MENYNRNYNVRKVKIYKDTYRPSTNLTLFFRSLWSIIWAGRSPITK